MQSTKLYNYRSIPSFLCTEVAVYIPFFCYLPVSILLSFVILHLTLIRFLVFQFAFRSLLFVDQLSQVACINALSLL